MSESNARVDAFAGTPSLSSRLIWFGVAASVLGVLIFLLLAPVTQGNLVMDRNSRDSVRAVAELVLQSYTDLTELVTAAFGLIAFVVSTRPTALTNAPRNTWNSLALSLLFLGAALLLCLFARERLITMIVNNAVQLGVPALQFSRVAVYVFLAAATIFIAKAGYPVLSAPSGAEQDRAAVQDSKAPSI